MASVLGVKPRIVAVHHWCRNGIALTTTWSRERRLSRSLSATTTWHKVEDGHYAGHSTLSVPVARLGEWNGKGAMVDGWERL